MQKLIVSVSFGTQGVFKWKGKSCSDGEAHLCCLGHGDILVMDGQCQNKFLHCTSPGLDQERIKVTFRWIRQHTTSCPLRAGVVCCLPTCSKSSTIFKILFRNVSLSRGQSKTRFGVSPFTRRKVTMFIGRETKTRILPTKVNEKKKPLRSGHLTIIILLEELTIQQQQDTGWWYPSGVPVEYDVYCCVKLALV